MVSDKDGYKRALVTLLRTLAALYGCALGVTRESADAEARKAYQPTNQLRSFWAGAPWGRDCQSRAGTAATIVPSVNSSLPNELSHDESKFPNQIPNPPTPPLES